ncbi:MAG: hypothetical protein ACRDK7_05390 [Solirubrobacteraceae bacterium]
MPAVAGQFNLGYVVVRTAIDVNPTTAALTISSDPLPQIIDGVPIRFRLAAVEGNRPGFMLDPTDCETLSLIDTATSLSGLTASLSAPFSVSGCGSLPFHPSFGASTGGSTSKRNGASLTARVSQSPDEADIHYVHVELPRALPSRLSTLQTACLAAQFEAKPAGCPAESVVGHAKAITPILPVPLEGPVYFVSYGGAAFPDVVFVLQGEGVSIVLVGYTFIYKWVLLASSIFNTVPDVPFSSFELTLPQGSVLSACRKRKPLPALVRGDQGVVIGSRCWRPVVQWVCRADWA